MNSVLSVELLGLICILYVGFRDYGEYVTTTYFGTLILGVLLLLLLLQLFLLSFMLLLLLSFSLLFLLLLLLLLLLQHLAGVNFDFFSHPASLRVLSAAAALRRSDAIVCGRRIHFSVFCGAK